MDAHEEDSIPKPQPSAAGMRRSSGGDASTTAVADDQQTPPAAGDTPVLKAKARRWGPEFQTAEAHLSPAVDGTPPPRGRSITLRDCKDGAGRDGSPGMKRDSSGTTRGGEHSGLPTNCYSSDHGWMQACQQLGRSSTLLLAVSLLHVHGHQHTEGI
jgi:hypothetical protein